MDHVARQATGGLLALVACLGLASCGDNTAGPDASSDDLQAVVERAVAGHGIPALGAVVLRGDQMTLAVAGVRKLGADDAVRPEDLWHLGSNTKAFTATLLGVLVESDSLDWSTRILDVFPELAAGAHEGYQAATLENLLSHRAGIPPFTEPAEFEALPDFPGAAAEQRYAFASWLLARPPAGAHGAYLYSNAGYAVAAAMAERIMGAAWEDLVQDLVCSPLGATCAIGWPGRHGADQPWGHLWAGGVLVPHDPMDSYRIPPLIAPAGDISLDLADYAAFLRLHLEGLRGADGLLAAATIQRLHAPIGDYALGWGSAARDGDAFSVHFGSAGTFLCGGVVCAPRNLAVAVIANAAHPGAEAGIAELLDWVWAQAGGED